jgi:thiamine-phosphate pyrophosphorylase
LYVICDADVCAAHGWRPDAFAAACFDGGAQLLQLRMKTASSRTFLDIATAVVDQGRRAAATVIINDRADIAMFAGAAGVHVGQEDLSPEAIRAVVGEASVVGLSTHTIEQIDAAIAAPISYLAVGPVFGTATKHTGYQAVGLALVREAANRAARRKLPVVAIGGITLENAVSVIDAGADSVAVISDLLVANDPAMRTRAFVERLASASR